MRNLRLMRRHALYTLLAISSVACKSTSTERELARLALRVDSLAVTLTTVVNAVRPKELQQRAPDSITVSTSGAATLGRPDAPVTIVEFTDYQCPFCARHASVTLPEIKEAYIDPGIVRYVVRDMPLEQLHSLAGRAARSARCAGAQSAEGYWAYHDELFASQRGLRDSDFGKIAGRIRLDSVAFAECLQSGQFKQEVDRDAAEGMASGLSGTPAFVIGRTNTNGSVTGIAIRGAYPFDQFKAAIDAALEPVQVSARE